MGEIDQEQSQVLNGTFPNRVEACLLPRYMFVKSRERDEGKP